MKKILKLKKQGKIIIVLLFFISLSLFIYSCVNIYLWIKDNKKINTQVTTIIEKVELIETEDNAKTEIIEPKKEEPKSSPYWDYIKTPLINVNFAELKTINNETKGWINLPGTNINYPFVQTDNNEYYLTHSFDKTKNKAGWIFLDYRNNIINLNKNTLLYGHSRVNNTMFGSLKKTLKNSWFKNETNHIIRISTETENTLWQIFSIYTIPETNDYLQTNFTNNEDFNNFINMIITRSKYNFKTFVSEDDFILTLSTCYKTNERLVVHAKLIKKEAR